MKKDWIMSPLCCCLSGRTDSRKPDILYDERAATAKYEKDDNKIVKYIMAGAGILIFVAIVVAILYVIAKKKRKQEKK